MSDRMASVKALMASINKKNGEDLIVLASEVKDMIPRVTSGSVGIDLILGGGWPANQWVELVGNESSGKTAVALKTIAANQERDPEWIAVWIAAEKWVSDYAEMCGVDLDRVLVVETNDMELAYDTAIKFAESREVNCIVIDSLPALIPSAEDEKDMEQSTVGRGALLTGKFFRKVGKATKRNLDGSERPVLGIVINQWRCIGADSLIRTPSGIVEARNIQPGNQVEGVAGWVAVKGVAVSPSQPSIRIESSLGRITVSEDHRQTVVGSHGLKEVPASEVSVGDWLVSPVSEADSDHLEDDLDAALLGAYFADGHVGAGKKGRYLDISETSLERNMLVRGLLSEKFGKDFSGVTSRLCRVGRVGADWVDLHGAGWIGKEKSVPDYVRKSRAAARSFLRFASFDTHKFERNRFYWTFETSRQAEEVSALLRWFGVHADFLGPDYLSVSADDAVRFAETVGFAEPTKQQKAKLFTNAANARGKRDLVPPALVRTVVAASGRPVSRAIAMALYKGAPAYRKEVLDLSVGTPYEEMIRSARFTRVTAVEQCISDNVDIEVDGGRFVAQNLLTHNSKIGVMYGDPRTTPGGVGKNYAYFVRVEVSRGDWLEIGTGSDKEKIGQTIQVRTIKNKTAPAQRVAHVDYYFEERGPVSPGGYDTAKEIVALALMEEVITRKGAFYEYGEHKWRGQQAMLDAIREDLDLYEGIEKQVRSIHTLGVR